MHCIRSSCFDTHTCTHAHIQSHTSLFQAEPDITETQLRGGDRFILVACDGLFDVMSNDEVVEYVTSRLAKGIAPEPILHEIVSYAIDDLGSTDNVRYVTVWGGCWGDERFTHSCEEGGGGVTLGMSRARIVLN